MGMLAVASLSVSSHPSDLSDLYSAQHCTLGPSESFSAQWKWNKATLDISPSSNKPPPPVLPFLSPTIPLKCEQIMSHWQTALAQSLTLITGLFSFTFSHTLSRNPSPFCQSYSIIMLHLLLLSFSTQSVFKIYQTKLSIYNGEKMGRSSFQELYISSQDSESLGGWS